MEVGFNSFQSLSPLYQASVPLEKCFEKSGCHVLNPPLAQYYQYMGFIVLIVGFIKNSDNCVFPLTEVEMLTSLF